LTLLQKITGNFTDFHRFKTIGSLWHFQLFSFSCLFMPVMAFFLFFYDKYSSFFFIKITFCFRFMLRGKKLSLDEQARIDALYKVGFKYKAIAPISAFCGSLCPQLNWLRGAFSTWMQAMPIREKREKCLRQC
jgi:hypothetical protein